MAEVKELGPNFGEDVPKYVFDFSEASIRRSFIRKVYSIVMCQLLVTMGFICLFVFHEPTQLFVESHMYIMWVSFGIVLGTVIVMGCCDCARRKAPNNYICLFIFTVALSVPLGVVSSEYQIKEVPGYIALGVTAVICLALTMFAFQTKWDFTMCGGWLLSLVMVLTMFGFMMLLLPDNNKLHLLYSGIGVLVFSMYLVYDTQIMMGGGHRYRISPEEYIFAALNIYLDIINLFLRFLK